MQTVELDIERGTEISETVEVEIDLDNSEKIIELMETVVGVGTNVPSEIIPLLTMEELATLYSAVVTEMDK